MTTMPTMPFGKHKDKPLDKIPKRYLRWVLKNCQLFGGLREDIQAVVEGKPLPPSEAELIEAIIGGGTR